MQEHADRRENDFSGDAVLILNVQAGRGIVSSRVDLIPRHWLADSFGRKTGGRGLTERDREHPLDHHRGAAIGQSYIRRRAVAKSRVDILEGARPLNDVRIG
jgi:hypothetical protein